jgi:hypothetical protein
MYFTLSVTPAFVPFCVLSACMVNGIGEVWVDWHKANNLQPVFFMGNIKINVMRVRLKLGMSRKNATIFCPEDQLYNSAK